jgi:gas vesicle protein
MQESRKAGAVAATGVFSGWSGFIMGAAVGVVIGLLLAPKPGRETRQIVGERMGRARETVQSRVQQTRERLRRAREPEASDDTPLRGSTVD